MNMTAIYVMAAVQRAQNEGASSVTLNVKDMIEMCNVIQAGLHKQEVEKPSKHLGWASPTQILRMASECRNSIPTKRRKSPDHCVQVFFTGNIHDHVKESMRLCAVRDAKNRASQEAANVQSTVS
jgi:hypothetical protein